MATIPKTDINEAITYLYREQGAHFVMCRLKWDESKQGYNKKPIHKWKERPALKKVITHVNSADHHVIGIKPWSLGMTALDVDNGDPSLILRRHPAVLNVASSLPARRHIWYWDSIGRRNSNWNYESCSGEIRSEAGFLILWHDAAIHLAEALASPSRADGCLFPAYILLDQQIQAANPADMPDISDTPQQAPVLEDIYPKERNIALFDTVRLWAYEQDVEDDFEVWVSRCKSESAMLNNRFPKPLPKDEAAHIGDNVAKGVWRVAHPKSHKSTYSAEQRKHGGLKRGRQQQIDALSRWVEVFHDVVSGMSKTDVARKHGLSRMQVYRIIKRQNHVDVVEAHTRLKTKDLTISARTLPGSVGKSVAP